MNKNDSEQNDKDSIKSSQFNVENSKLEQDAQTKETQYTKQAIKLLQEPLTSHQDNLNIKSIHPQKELFNQNKEPHLEIDSLNLQQKLFQKSDEEEQKQNDKGSFQIESQDVSVTSTAFEKDLQELDSYLNLKQIKEYLKRGKETVEKVSGKNAVIVIGTTGAGKTTSILYLLGYKMQEEDFTVEELDEKGQKQQFQKKVIGSVEKVDNAKIGNTNVSETQFLNVFNIRNGNQNFYISDSPGFKDKRKLEIDLTNNLNIINMLNACKSIRFVFLVNYHELKGSKGAPFIETALIAAKMLNISNFEKNLESVCIFYTHIQGIEIKTIKTEIASIKKAIPELDLMSNSDKDLLKIFLNYLLEQIIDGDSLLLNPLDLNERQIVLNKIFSKPGMETPAQKISQVSFSPESESRVNYYLNIAKEKIEKYASEFMFKEVSELLTSLQNLFENMPFDNIEKLIQSQQIKIAKDFQKKLENQIQHVVENLKNGNRFTQQFLNELMATKKQLVDWEENRFPHFTEYKIDSSIFISQIYEKFKQTMNQKIQDNQKFENLIQITQSLDYLHQVLDKEYTTMKEFIREKINILMDTETKQAFLEINEKLQGKQLSNDSQYFQLVQSILDIISKLKEKEELVIKYKLSDTLDVQKQIIQNIFNVFNQKEKELLSYFEVLKKGLDQQLAEQAILELSTKLNGLTSSFYLIMAFAQSQYFSEICPQICQIENNIKEKFKVAITIYFTELNNELRIKKLKSKYLKEYIMNFLKKLKLSFQKNDQYIEKDYRNYHIEIEQSIKQKEEQIKNNIKVLTQGKDNTHTSNSENNTQNADYFPKILSNQKHPCESAIKSLNTLYSIKWMDSYFEDKTISLRIEYYQKKLLKFFNNQLQFVEKIAEEILQENEIDQKRILYQSLQKQYLTLKEIRRHFRQLLPATNERFQEIFDSLQKQFQDVPAKFSNQTKSLESLDTLSKHLLFDLETSLITLKYIPKDLLSNQIISKEEFVEKFEDYLKKKINQIPSQAKWETLLNQNDFIFKKWAMLLEDIDLLKLNKSSLSLLLEKSTFFHQILDDKFISNKIKNLHNHLKNNMNESFEKKNFQKAEKISLTLNSMSTDLSEYFQFEQIYQMGEEIRKETQSLISDIQQQNNLKSIKERFAHLRENPSNQKDCEWIQQNLKEQYDKQLKILMKEIINQNIKDQELQQKIENLFEMKYVLEDILDKRNLEEKFNQNFLIPFQQYSEETIMISFLLYSKSGKDQELLNLYKWYKKIIVCLNTYSVDIKNMVNLEELLIKSFNNEIKKVTQNPISIWSKVAYSDFLHLIQQIDFQKNLFFFNQNIQNKLQDQQNTLKNYLDNQILQCKKSFQEQLGKNPVNIGEAKKVITKMKNFEEIYQKYYNDTEIVEDIQAFQIDLETKENAQLQIIQEYLESFTEQDESQDQQILNMINEIIQQDKIGFQKIQVLITKKNEENYNELNNMLNQNQDKIFQYQQVLPILNFFQKLKKLKQNKTQSIHFEGKTIFSFSQLIAQLVCQFNSYLKNLQKILSNSNDLISRNELMNFFDMQLCIQKLRVFPNINRFSIGGLQNEILHIKDKIYEKVRESINYFNQSYDNSSYTGLLKSLKPLEQANEIIQYIKSLQGSENQIPQCCDNRLWEVIESSNIKSYQIAYDLTQKLFQQAELDLNQSWKKNDFKLFSQIFKNLKQLFEYQPQNNLMSKTYKQLKDDYEKQISSQQKIIINNIRLEEWDVNLSKQVDMQQDQVENLLDTDFCQIVLNSQEDTQQKLKDKLNEKLQEFKEENNIENKGQILICLRKICDSVPNFEVQVKKKINECINALVANSNNGQNQIISLSNVLSQSNDPMAELILKEVTHFSSLNVKNFKQKISGQHNPAYINKNLRKLCFLTNRISNFNSIEQKNLEDRYNHFQEKFQQTVNEYLKKINKIGDLADEIVKYAAKRNNINLDMWNQKSQEDCNYLLSYICAFWTLSGLQKDLVQDVKQIDYRELHTSQIYTLMVFLGFESSLKNQKLENQIIQILTGEGKSIILGIFSSLLALLGYNVDVVCYSRHLSDRDLQDFENFFESLKIKEKIKYGTFTDICEDKINQQGDIRQFSKELLEGSIANQTNPTKQKSILLTDEVDVLFSDSFFGKTYNPSCLWKSKEIMNIMKKIWHEKVLKKETLLNLIFKEKDFLSLRQKFPKLERLLKVHIKSMLNAAINIKDHKYIFQDCKIGYQEQDSISFTTVQGYSTNFAYFQEMDRGNITEEQVEAVCSINLQCGHFSYCLLPSLYSKIFGVTGTLETLNKEYLNIVGQYAQKAALIPSMFGSTKLKEDHSNLLITYDEENFFLTIMDEAIKHLDKGQPVLIFFKDNLILQKFVCSNYVSQFKNKLLILNQQTRHLKTTINKACRYGQLTICERAFGRGTDFQCTNKEINNLGGVVVIQTFFSEQITEEFQIKGRTARQSNEGKFQIVLNANDLQESQIQVEELKQQSQSQLYQYLDSKRKEQQAEKVKKLRQFAIEAKLLHDETITYSNFLKQNKVEDALNMLIKFNSGKSTEQFIHFLLLLDDSGSMSCEDETGKSRWGRLIEAINTFIQERTCETSSNNDIASIIYHSCDSISVAKYEKLTNLSSILNKNQPRYKGNQFYLAINEAINILDNEPNQYKSMKKVIMFLSDGGDDSRQEKRTESLNNLKSKYKEKILGFWCVGFGPGAEIGALQDMTNTMKECGGEYKIAMDVVELQYNFSDLASIDAVMALK